MSNDNWEVPVEYHQVALVGGWVADIGKAEYTELWFRMTQGEERYYICDDIYGGEVCIVLAQIAAVRQHSPTVAARYRLAHEDDED